MFRLSAQFYQSDTGEWENIVNRWLFHLKVLKPCAIFFLQTISGERRDSEDELDQLLAKEEQLQALLARYVTLEGPFGQVWVTLKIGHL